MIKGIPLPAVLVDIETTGGPRHGRITEVAIIEIDEHEIREWSTLVNPEIEIPIDIQLLTGITNEMVAATPHFEEVAEEIFLKLKDKLFIAHNVSFDYGFLRKELGSVGISFKAPLMCSVKLSRALYPQAESHSLENIIIRHNISVRYRHRALDDAQATYRFLKIAENEHGSENFQLAFHRQFQYGDLPLHVDPETIAAIPRISGIYYLWDSDKTLLYIGKGSNIRVEVYAQFLSGEKSPIEAKLASLTADITWETTPGELSAIILHTQKVNQFRPTLNKRAQTVESLCSILLEENKKGWLVPRIVFADEIATSFYRLYGLFTTEKHALKEIKKLFASRNLCFNTLPSNGSDNLFSCERADCKLCKNGENHLKHNIRLQAAFEQMALQRWPFKAPIAIEESSNGSERLHIIVNNWCLLGIARNIADYEDILSSDNAKLDRNIYKYLMRFIKNDTPAQQFKILSDFIANRNSFSGSD